MIVLCYAERFSAWQFSAALRYAVLTLRILSASRFRAKPSKTSKKAKP